MPVLVIGLVPLSSVGAYALIDLNHGISPDKVAIGADVPLKIEPRAVETQADLETYAQAALAADESIEEINFTDNSVEVRYKETGQFLALVPIRLSISAAAYADGHVEVKYPWYAIFTLDRQDEIETQLKIAVNTALAARMVGWVQAEGEVENPIFTASESAQVADEMHTVLHNAFEPS